MFTDDTTHYFFSSSAQTIAALVGISAAFAVFRYQMLVTQVTDLSKEICDRVHELIHGRSAQGGPVQSYDGTKIELNNALTGNEREFLRGLHLSHEKVEFWAQRVRSCESPQARALDDLMVLGSPRANQGERYLSDHEKQMLQERRKSLKLLFDQEHSALVEYKRIKEQVETLRGRALDSTMLGLILVGIGLMAVTIPSLGPINIVPWIGERGFAIGIYCFGLALYGSKLIALVKSCLTSIWDLREREKETIKNGVQKLMAGETRRFHVFIHVNSGQPVNYIGGIAPVGGDGAFFGGAPAVGATHEDVKGQLVNTFKSSTSYQPGDKLYDLDGKVILKK